MIWRISRPHQIRVIATVAGLFAIGAGIIGCGSSADSVSGPSRAASTSAKHATTTLTVFAAASLKETFSRLESSFEAKHPGVDVVYNFAGSSDLAAQINAGAPADVFASADSTNMRKVNDLVQDPETFASNMLTIVTAPGNPKGIKSFADLADPDLFLAVCQAEQPCGKATARVQKALDIHLAPDTEEPSVKDVLGKVETGQADAGLVYVTDAIIAKQRVDAVAFPAAAAAANTYPIAVVKESAHTDLANEFVAMVTGAEGQRVFAAAGFGKP